MPVLERGVPVGQSLSLSHSLTLLDQKKTDPRTIDAIFWQKINVLPPVGGEHYIGARPLKKIVFIGDGLAVTAGLYYLMKIRPFATPLAIVIAAKNDSIGPGVAYNRLNHPSNLLNNTCIAMSFCDAPDDFLTWAKKNTGLLKGMNHTLVEGGIQECSYLPRQFYGRFLEEKVKETLGKAKSVGIDVDVYYENPAVGISRNMHQPNTLMVQLNQGQKILADQVYLGTGGFEPRFGAHLLNHPLVQSGEVTYIHSYNELEDIASQIAEHRHIVVIGSSLSAIDVMNLVFQPGQDPDKTLVFASRTGKLPGIRPKNLEKFEPQCFTLDAIRQLKKEGNLNKDSLFSLLEKEAALKGFSINISEMHWPKIENQTVFNQELIQSFRENLDAIEKGNPQNQAVFLYHMVYSVLETAKHLFSSEEFPAAEQAEARSAIEGFILNWGAPMPPVSAHKMLRLIDSGHLQFFPGLSSIDTDNKHQALVFCAGTGETLPTRCIINATGSGQVEDFSKLHDPCADSMIAENLAAPYVRDGVSLGGLDYSPETGNTNDASGKAVENVYLVGQWRKGRQLVTNSAGFILEDVKVATDAMRRSLEK